MTGQRLMLVHAHPDDETIETGATMAAYAAAGTQVTLVTCTLGELGEIIPPELAGLAAGRQDRLGEYRRGELAAACAALGVTDQRYLGGPGRWRDSGMMGLPANGDPRCFWQAPLEEAAAELAAIVCEVRPQVAVTYDERGYYGHPDHIQAHRVTVRALALAAGGGPRPAAGAPWQVAKLYATAMPRSVLAEAIRLDRAGPRPQGFTQARSVSGLPYGVDDGLVTTAIDGTAHLPAKIAAMRAHATQILVDGEFFALSDRVGQRILGWEYYTRLALPAVPAAGTRFAAGPPGAPAVWERDLFAGL